MTLRTGPWDGISIQLGTNGWFKKIIEEDVAMATWTFCLSLVQMRLGGD